MSGNTRNLFLNALIPAFLIVCTLLVTARETMASQETTVAQTPQQAIKQWLQGSKWNGSWESQTTNSTGAIIVVFDDNKGGDLSGKIWATNTNNFGNTAKKLFGIGLSKYSGNNVFGFSATGEDGNDAVFYLIVDDKNGTMSGTIDYREKTYDCELTKQSSVKIPR